MVLLPRLILHIKPHKSRRVVKWLFLPSCGPVCICLVSGMMLVAGEVRFVSECCILPPVGMERGAQGGCRSCGCHHGGHGSDTRLSSWDEFGAVRGAPGSVGSWGAGEVAQQGLVGDVAYKKKLPPNNTVLYLSAGCINPICIQYQSDGKPVSGSVTPSPSGCNSSFTSENQIHISEAHRTERAHFFLLLPQRECVSDVCAR